MPSRNAIKQYVRGGYYHVYNRGHSKDLIFRDTNDYAVLMNHFKRHLSQGKVLDRKGRPYEKLFNEVDLVAFCLMPNHYHFIVHQKTEDGMARFMKRIMNSYANYHNALYSKQGPLFQGRYKAVLLDSLEYQRTILEYVHRNPKKICSDYRQYEYSSAPAYYGRWKADWLTVHRFDE